MKTNTGNRDARFVWQSLAAGSGTNNMFPGDGLSPSYPIAEQGGRKRFMLDVTVPAIPAGAAADWATPYPTVYTSPYPRLDLLVYANPADTAQKLHGKGNLHVLSAQVYLGTVMCGAAAPTQAGGTCVITISTPNAGTILWQKTGALPAAAGIIVPTTRLADGLIIGADWGVDDRLVLEVNPVTNPIVAGRWRIAIEAIEV